LTERVLGDRYRLGEQVGAGGMAKVYRALDARLDRPVAVKVLAPQFASDPSFVDRFRREAQTAAKLSHPNIVGVYDNGSDGETHYIVMEYVEGRTLVDFLAGGGHLSLTKSVEVTMAVCEALEYAHDHGVVHRDIKPGNIMVTREGQVKVMDFGIARLTTTAETIAQTAAVLGTAAYLSPEQAQGQRVDRRTDIYSLGCVLYELLTGAPPFSGETAMAVAMQHVQEVPAAPSLRNPEISPQMDAVVMKALAKNPANRYQTAAEFRDDLDRIRRGELVSATPLLPAAAPTEVIHHQAGPATAMLPPGEEEGRKWWVVPLIVLAILAILAGGAYFLASSLLGAQSAKVTVPDVTGLSLQDATAKLAGAGLRVSQSIQHDRRPGFDPGTVIAQNPKADERVPRDTAVVLTLQSSSQTQTIPSVAGASEQQATALLAGEPYRYTVTTRQRFDPSAAAGSAIGTDPAAGTPLKSGSPITLLISKGESPSATTTSPTASTVVVPDVVCRSINSAQTKISQAGLTPTVVGSQPNSSCPKANKVATQAPAGGTSVAQGTTVKLWTSEPGNTSPPPT
jgi:eukaryotic-like serine/threonine-protein kinase